MLSLPATPGTALLDAHIELSLPGKPPQLLAFADRDLGRLPVGTRLRLIVENRGAGSVDLGIVHLPLNGQPARVYPPFEGDSNRMPPGIAPAASRFEQRFEVSGPDLGPEWLALVAAPAANGALPRRFALLEALQDAPLRRGAGGGEVRNADLAQLARLSWTSVAAGQARRR